MKLVQFGALVRLFVFSLTLAAVAAQAGTTIPLEECVPNLHTLLPVPKRKLEDIQDLKIGTLNTFNLFTRLGKYETAAAPVRGLKKVTEARVKDPKQIEALAKFIRAKDLDFVVLEEIEGKQSLEDFVNGYLGDNYHFFWTEGNDERGIQIAILAKRDLPFKFEFRTHKAETWVNTVLKDGEETQTGETRTVFSRDLPLVLVRPDDQPEDQPLFALFGTHYKSKRNRAGDPDSSILRRAQVERTTSIVQKLQAEFKFNLPVVLAGDFNGSLEYEPEYLSLWRSNHFSDSLDTVESQVPIKDRITHTFHPREGNRKLSQIDAVLVTDDLKDAITHAEVYRYTDENGKELPLPATYQEREQNPSDHFPVYMQLSFPKLMGSYRARSPASIKAVGKSATDSTPQSPTKNGVKSAGEPTFRPPSK